MAARWMQQKMAKLKPQITEAAHAEMTKACYFTSKPEVPAYDGAMVRRIENKTKPRKTVYRAAPVKTLVTTGIGVIGSWDKAGESRLIKRR